MPNSNESPTMWVVFLLYFWRFSFELSDIHGFLIWINFPCCFWQNSISWFPIVFVYLFSKSRCYCILSYRYSLLCVWFSVISLHVMFCAIWYHLYNLKSVKKKPWRSVTFSKVAGLKPATSLKATLLHRRFLRLLNYTNGTKSLNYCCPYSIRVQENKDQKKLRVWTLLTLCWTGWAFEFL